MRGSDTPKGHRSTVAGIILAALGVCVATSPGQDQMLPVSVQVPLFLKIMSFDRSLATQRGAPVVIGVIFQSTVRVSADVKTGFVRELERSSRKGVPIHYVPLDIDGEESLAEAIRRSKANMLYVTPLRSVAVDAITAISREHQIPTLSAVPEYVEAGIAVGVVLNGRKPQIVVNLPAAKAENIDFSSQLLKMARIIE